MLKEGRFPKPSQIAGRNYWREDVLAEWVEKNAPRPDNNATESGDA
jgi:predicted DNA-binding transcriptional regulator AlpA